MNARFIQIPVQMPNGPLLVGVEFSAQTILLGPAKRAEPHNPDCRVVRTTERRLTSYKLTRRSCTAPAAPLPLVGAARIRVNSRVTGLLQGKLDTGRR
jgi:hypothetical protein